MNTKKAKEYYELGILTGFDAIRDPLGGGWLLVVVGQDDRSWTMQTARGDEKTYSKLDTLVEEVESITGGFSALHISL